MKDCIVKIKYEFEVDGEWKPATIQHKCEAESEFSALMKVINVILNDHGDWIYAEQLKRGKDISINVISRED